MSFSGYVDEEAVSSRFINLFVMEPDLAMAAMHFELSFLHPATTYRLKLY